MSPRKRVHETDAERHKTFRDRQKVAGRRRICGWVSAEAAETLKEIAEAAGETQAETLERLIMEGGGKPKE